MRSGSEKQLGHRDRATWDTSGVLLEHAPEQGLLDLPTIFGNRRPVELEIGTGKGTFLLARAKHRPEINFLGIEYAKAYGLYAADRFRRHGLDNVRMLCTDAGPIVARCLADNSLLRLHVYFPDPWPKRKHHRRRLVQPAFVAQARRVLQPGGLLLLKTDHRDYFDWMRQVLCDAPGFARIPFPKVVADEDRGMVGTNFERKYIAEGRPFYSLALLRYA